MQLIETKVLASAAAAIEFTSIPQDGTDLLILTSLRTDFGSGGWAQGLIRPNGATTNLTQRQLYGYSTVVGSSLDSSIGVITVLGGDSPNTFGNASVYIPNYTSSSNKSFSVDTSGERNNVASLNAITAGLWTNTAAITSLTVFSEVGSFSIGSTISLYKITKGSDGIVTTS